jgi:hypothetical protein
MTHLIEVLSVIVFFLVPIAGLLLTALCNHRLILTSYSSRIDRNTKEFRFVIQNMEEVGLDIPIEVQLRLDDGQASFSAPARLLCGTSAFVHDKDGTILMPNFTERQISFYLSRMRPLATWVAVCRTQGDPQCRVNLTLYGYDPNSKGEKHTSFFPLVDNPIISSLTARPERYRGSARLFTICAYVLSTACFLLSTFLQVPNLSAIEREFDPQIIDQAQQADSLVQRVAPDLGILVLMLLIIFWCSRSVRRRSQLVVQSYIGWDLDPDWKASSFGMTASPQEPKAFEATDQVDPVQSSSET